MAAEQAKDRGNRAYSAGLYTDAVACFSEALAIAPSAPNTHVFYSNRSAAQLKLYKAEEALKDADQCISLKPDWPKGYSRRGSALYALGRYTDAYRAYKDGLSYEASNEGLLEGLRSVEAKLSTQRAGTSYGASTSTSSPPSAANLQSFLLGSKTNMFQLYQFVLRSLLLLCFVNFWIPVLLSSYEAYANFFKLALITHASYLAFTHGVPRWSAVYAQRLMLDPAVQVFIFCVVFWFSDPHGMAMIPVFLLEIVHYFAYLHSLLQVLGLTDSTVVTFVTSKVLVPLTSVIITDLSFSTLATRAKWAKLNTRMPQVAANIDVAIGIALLLEMLLPSRNFLLLVLYWQVLRIRYMISPQLQEAFRALHGTILTLVNHPRCPAVFSVVYGKIHAFAVKMSDAAQQQQASSGAGGLASRCSIM
ncbi:unnamed protein product [Peronospora destructor]|uniref:Hsp70-Hsp90 organising protein n=1 Tax=Peronospora destructor TaxID=86335 RepID=A0AAV0T670_9STRA|nr:unnamed protein product [Peronospora destructor]